MGGAQKKRKKKVTKIEKNPGSKQNGGSLGQVCVCVASGREGGEGGGKEE